MNTTVDRFGRIVIPKKIRDGLGLEPGSDLVIEATDGGILLRPVEAEPNLVEHDGVLVFTGKAEEDLAAAVERLRTERLDGLATGQGSR